MAEATKAPPDEHDSGERWGYADEEHPDQWTGAGRTRAEAITDGRETYPGESFWIQRGHIADPMQFLPDASVIAETAWQSAIDEVGDPAEDWPQLTEAATKELDDFLEAWAAKHLTCAFWVEDVESKAERIEPRAAVDVSTDSVVVHLDEELRDAISKQARSHCGRDPGPIGCCGGTDETCSCECNTCLDPR